jgi:hypothetical protein
MLETRSAASPPPKERNPGEFNRQINLVLGFYLHLPHGAPEHVDEEWDRGQRRRDFLL